MERSVARWFMASIALLCGCAPRAAVDDRDVFVDQGLPAQLTALGTEPFWAAVIDGEGLLYQTPEDPQGRRVALNRSVRDGRTELRGKLSGETFVVRIDSGPCSDGMSDTVYPYAAALRIGQQVLIGCAKPH